MKASRANLLAVATVLFLILLWVKFFLKSQDRHLIPTSSPTSKAISWQLELQKPPILQKNEIFLAHCAGCHGEHGKGDGPGYLEAWSNKATNLTDSASYKCGCDIASVTKVISDGILNRMPPFKKTLSPIELRSVADYVVLLQERNYSSSRGSQFTERLK